METVYSYDGRNRPVNIETAKDATTLMSLTYTYDKSGSVTSISNGTYTETYTYDLLDRLTDTVGPWGSISYSYDAAGNRLSKSVQGGSTTIYSYDSMDRLIGATGLGFDWDTNGNMVYMDDGVHEWNYTYDPLNRLVKVSNDGSLSALYTYDAGGRRVRSWDDVDGNTDYVYSGLNVIDEVRGGAHEKHVYAGSMHMASNSSGTVEYYHVDHPGSTRLKTDASGSAIYGSNYEPFGPEYGESGSEEFRYTGKQEDPTGLYYYGARYYDPVTGRFTTRDSVFSELSNPQSLNKYSYCWNNPHKYIDPDGLWALQIGVSGSGGLGIILNAIGIGGEVGGGIVISHDKSTGLQWGFYTQFGGGLYIGESGASAGWDITYTPSAKTIEEVGGSSIDATFEVAKGTARVGGGVSIPINDKQFDLSNLGYKFDIPFPLPGGGSEISLQISYTQTTIYPRYKEKIGPWKPERDRWWEEPLPMKPPDLP